MWLGPDGRVANRDLSRNCAGKDGSGAYASLVAISEIVKIRLQANMAARPPADRIFTKDCGR